MSDQTPAAVELDAPAAPPVESKGLLPALWVTVALLLIGAVVAAFVVGDAEDPPGQRLAAAAEQATAEDFAFEAKVGGDGLPQAVVVKGAVDVETSRVRGTIDYGDGAALELIQDGTVQYYRLPAELRPPGSKPWQRLDLSSFGLQARSSSTNGNPLDVYAQLGAIVGEVERVGEEKVRGTSTVHFRATVDVTKTFPDGMPPVSEEAVAGLRRVPIDVWLDDRDRPRRFRQSVELPGSGEPPVRVTTSVDSFAYGEPVDVQLPAAEEVEDIDISGMSSLLEALPAD